MTARKARKPKVKTEVTASCAPVTDPGYPEADAKGFAILAAVDRGVSQRGIKAEIKTSAPFIAKCIDDTALRDRFEEWKKAQAAAARMKVAEEVAATVLDTGSITLAAEKHGVSRVTVYKYLEDTGVVRRVRELNALQRELREYAAGRATLEALPAVLALLTDRNVKSGTGKAALLEVLRKMATGEAGGTSLNVAVSGSGAAIVGAGQVAVTLPAPPHEGDLGPQKIQALARMLLEADALPEIDLETVRGNS